MNDMYPKSKESETSALSALSALTTKINDNTSDSIINPTDKLTQAQPEALYHGGARGAPPRGKIGDSPPFYERAGLPANNIVDSPKCIFECYMDGRGHLYYKGPNGTADLMLTFNVKGVLYGLFIRRKKEDKHAMPGGMIDTNESFAETCIREFFEEAYAGLSSLEKNLLLNYLLYNGEIKYIYKGIMDDSRNTNDAWIESTIINIHIDNEYSEEFMNKFKILLSPCEKETLGAEIAVINPDFIETTVWKTHQKAISAVYEYHMNNMK